MRLGGDEGVKDVLRRRGDNYNNESQPEWNMAVVLDEWKLATECSSS